MECKFHIEVFRMTKHILINKLNKFAYSFIYFKIKFNIEILARMEMNYYLRNLGYLQQKIFKVKVKNHVQWCPTPFIEV